MTLSKKSLELIAALFSDKSRLELPVGVAQEVLEIREWVQGELQSPLAPKVEGPSKGGE